jgi:hypothetical protein
MSRATLPAAKTELVTLLRTGTTPTVSGVTEVFDYLPPLEGLRGPVSVCVYTDSITSDFWRIGVRVYLTATVDPKKAQDDLDALLPALDAKMTAGFGPSTWEVGFPTLEQPYFNATGIFEVGRQDYY